MIFSLRADRFALCHLSCHLNARTGVQIARQACQSIDAKMDVSSGRTDIDPSDEQANDAGLFRRKQLIPERLEPVESLADVGLDKPFDCASGGSPGLDDDFRCAQECPNLTDDRSLDLA